MLIDKIFKNIKLGRKLAIMLLIPILGLLFIAQIEVRQKLELSNEVAAVQEFVELSVHIGALIHELQLERGVSSSYIASKGTKHRAQLFIEYAATDDKSQILNSFLETFPLEFFDAKLRAELSRAQSMLDGVISSRQQVLSLDIPIGQAVGAYSHLDAQFLDVIAFLPKLSSIGEINLAGTAYINFLQTKERAGQECALLTNVFTTKDFTDEVVVKFLKLVNEQSTYADVFLHYATDKQKELYQQREGNSVFRDVVSLRKDALELVLGMGDYIDPQHWFDLTTKRIDMLKDFEDQLSSDFIVLAEVQRAQASSALVVTSITTAVTLLISMLLGWYGMFIITRPIQKSVNLAKQIADGDLSSAPEQEYSRDETGQLLQAMHSMQEKLSVMIQTEIQSVVDGASRGDLDQRVALDGKQGFYKNLAAAINAMLDVNTQLVNDVLKAVRETVEGRLDYRVKIEDKEGFYLTLCTSINELIGVNDSVIKDVGMVIGAMAKGDLTRVVSTDYTGSYDLLKQDINLTTVELTRVFTDIKNTTAQVKAGSGEISSGNLNLSERTEQQAASLEQTSATMEQMTASVRQNADNAKHADTLARDARGSAEIGSEVVDQAVKAMGDINESSSKIAEIIGVIDEIAFQTNLLALNAAVEAARAGEHGRGFAVVASEVRNLAGRSATAAKEIQILIQDSREKVDEGSKLVNRSGEVLAEINTSVKQVSDIVSEIASASSEQAGGIDEVGKAIAHMDDMTQQNAALVEESAAASELLSEQSDDLENLVSFFNVGDDVAVATRPKPQKQAGSDKRSRPASAETPVKDDDGDWSEF